MKLQVNPVYKKELKTSSRSMKMAMIILGYNGLLAVIGLLAFFLTFESGSHYNGINYSDILSIYMVMAVIEFGLVLFVVPAFTSGSISGERERQTLEILLTTRLKPIQIVLGKLASSISMVLLLVVSSIPVLSIVFSIGGIGLKDMAQLVFLVLVTAVFIGSIGILFSTLFRRTVPSTVFTYGSVIMLTLGTLFILGISYLIEANSVSRQNIVYGMYSGPDVGNMVLILLINPIFTMIAMMTDQYASSSLLSEILNQFGHANSFILEHWFWISILVQMFLSVLCILAAARLLDPLKRQAKIKKK